VVFYAVVSGEIEQVIACFVDREDAETMLARVLVDEPEWEESLRVEPVELATGGAELARDTCRLGAIGIGSLLAYGLVWTC
jgi:hypothetical protein